MEIWVLTVPRATGVVVCGRRPKGFGHGTTGFFEHNVYGLAQRLDVRGDLGDAEVNNEVKTEGPFLCRE